MILRLLSDKYDDNEPDSYHFKISLMINELKTTKAFVKGSLKTIPADGATVDCHFTDR